LPDEVTSKADEVGAKNFGVKIIDEKEYKKILFIST